MNRAVVSGLTVSLLACSAPSTSTTAGTLASPLDQKKLDPSICDPSNDFTLDGTTNPYWPLSPVGAQSILQGEEDSVSVDLIITVLDATSEISGVVTRVIEERELRDGLLAEVSLNFFAMSDTTVCYFGEAVDIYDEDGASVISHEGSWQASEPGNAPGIFMPEDPRPGMKFQIENAPGVAQDEATIVGQGPSEVPFGSFGEEETIRLREFNPLDGDKDYKVHVAGVGIVVDGDLELVSTTFFNL